MKIAPYKDFTKTYGTIDSNLKPGIYSVNI